jgi:hypothetical protein
MSCPKIEQHQFWGKQGSSKPPCPATGLSTTTSHDAGCNRLMNDSWFSVVFTLATCSATNIRNSSPQLQLHLAHLSKIWSHSRCPPGSMAPLTLASLVDQGSIEYSNCCLCLAGPADIVLQYLVGAEFVTRKYCFYLCIINAYIWYMFI